MEIKVDEDRLEGGKKLIEHKGKKSFIRIPLRFENWEDRRINHYRIDKIEIIDGNDEEKSPEPPEKKNILERTWENIKKMWGSTGANSRKKITGFYTPEKSRDIDVEPTEDELKTTKVVKHDGLWCEAIVENKKSIKKLEKYKKYKMDLSLLPESGGEIKHEIIFEVESEPKKKPKIRRPPEYYILILNLIFFTTALIISSLWNILLNHDAYGQPVFFKDSVISVAIGLMTGYFGFSIALFIAKLIWPKSDSRHPFKFPEFHFEKDFVKKLKKKRNFAILAAALALSIFLLMVYRPVSLPALPLEYLSYYDSETDLEIEHERVYPWNFSKIRMGINKRQRKTKQPFYVAGLRYDKKNELVPDYYEFTIDDSLMSECTAFSFEEIVDGKRLEGDRRYVFDHICGKKLSDENIEVNFDGKKKFTVIPVDYLTLGQLTKRLKKFYKTISTRNFDINTYITEKNKALCSYKEKFTDSIGTKTVRAEELLGINEFYAKKMDSSFENDIKLMALVWCQLHTSMGFNIKFTGKQVEKILEIFESYYHKKNIKSISEIDGRITQIYLRLLLYIEKNFAEDAYAKIHASINRVLDRSGGEYYLFYLEESVRNNVLFEPYLEASEISLRAAFFKKKCEIFRKLRKAKTILKRIYNLKEADERSKGFIKSLIEALTPKPAAAAKVEGNSTDPVPQLSRMDFSFYLWR